MRRNNGTLILILFVIFALLLSGFGIYASEKGVGDVSARAAALYDPEGERFLYTKNAHERLYMASTTKIMTAIVVAENLPLDRVMSIPAEAVGTEGSSAYFKEGEMLTVEGALFALLLRSANDAAVALAIELSGSTEAFALKMNEKADSLGLTDTNFTNPHGLHDEEHYTTAADLAKIAAAAMKNETVSRIVREKSRTVNTSLGTHLFHNHNKLLWKYEDAVGVKTGFTKNAGRCLVGAAKRDGVELISVTLDAPDDWHDHEVMLDFGFSLLESRVLFSDGEYAYTLPVIGGAEDFATVAPAYPARAVLPKDAPLPTGEVRLPRYLVAPTEVGDTVGELVFKDGDKVIARVPMVAKSEVQKQKKKGFTDKIKDFFKK